MLFDTYHSLFTNSLFLSLFSSMILYWVSLIFKKPLLLFRLSGLTALFASLILSLSLVNRWISYGYFPLSNLYESLLFLSCILLVIYQIIELKTQSKLFGSIIVPIVLLITSFANLTLPPDMQRASSLVPALQSNWLMMHVSLMMLSYAILIIGSLLSIIFVIVSFYRFGNQSFTLLTEQIGSQAADYVIGYQNSTPSTTNSIYFNDHSYFLEKDYKTFLFLKTVDNSSYRYISLGFPLLTIGIISGAIWANEAWGSYWSWDPKETWALVTWLIFAAYLHIRLIKGWEGKRPAFLASCGFLVVWICYLGVNFLGQGLHSYGWISST